MTMKQEGIKHDQDKAPWHLLPFDAIEEVVNVLSFGATKYTARNWEKGMEYSRLYSAAMRHMIAFWARQNTDEESQCYHLAHATTCLLFLMSYHIRSVGADDRPETTAAQIEALVRVQIKPETLMAHLPMHNFDYADKKQPNDVNGVSHSEG